MSEENAIVISEAVQLGIIQTASPQDVVNKASEIATAVSKVVENKKLYTIIRGRKYVHVEGWTTMGALLGVTPREVECHRLEDGGYVGTVELVRGDGVIIGRASAMVGMDEKDSKGNITWGKRDEYARYSFALTRATGKAYRLAYSWIMQLAGYAPTPAEEMNPDDKPFENDDVKDGEFKDAPKKAEHKSTSRPMPPETLAEMIAKKAELYRSNKDFQKIWDSLSFKDAEGNPRTARDKFVWQFSQLSAGDENIRHAVSTYLFGVPSSKDIDEQNIVAALDWMKYWQKSDTGEFLPGQYVQTEFDAVIQHLSGEIQEDGKPLNFDDQPEEKF